MALRCLASTGAISRSMACMGVVGVRPREIEEHAADAFQRRAAALQRLDGVGESGRRLVIRDGGDFPALPLQRLVESRTIMSGRDGLEGRDPRGSGQVSRSGLSASEVLEVMAGSLFRSAGTDSYPPWQRAGRAHSFAGREGLRPRIVPASSALICGPRDLPRENGTHTMRASATPVPARPRSSPPPYPAFRGS